MKLHFLGTCSGTEPMPGRHHTSWVLETEGRLYWFDAGEGCSYTGYLMGLDPMAIAKIIISHPHIDHVGGLANLLAVLKKINSREKRLPIFGDIDVYIPSMDTWDGVCRVLDASDKTWHKGYEVRANSVTDGVLFDDGYVRVTAYHNYHLKGRCFEPWQSFSYRIECEGKRVVFSGDIGAYNELDEVIGEGCDAAIAETGHFGIDDVRDYFATKKYGHLFFCHNGREILNFPEQSQEKVRTYFEGHGTICEDGMTVEL